MYWETRAGAAALAAGSSGAKNRRDGSLALVRRGQQSDSQQSSATIEAVSLLSVDVFSSVAQTVTQASNAQTKAPGSIKASDSLAREGAENIVNIILIER